MRSRSENFQNWTGMAVRITGLSPLGYTDVCTSPTELARLISSTKYCVSVADLTRRRASASRRSHSDGDTYR
jgi:hypothetical protein